MTKLADFLKENGITTEELVKRSKALESHHIADRALMVKRQNARKDKKPYGELSLDKPKGLGRPIGPDALKKVLDGAPVPRLVRKKVVRAVNSALATAKKEAVDTRALFADVKSRKGKKKK